LREQLNINKARRQRVFDIAQDRLAYQEYVETREILDRQISSVYSRLQKRDSVKSASAKKRKKPGSAALMEEKEKEKPHSPAALGLGPDPSGRLVVIDQLKQAVDLRRRWVDQVGSTLKKMQEEHPGRLWGLPPKSVYDGLEEDIKALEREKEKSENG
jgi:transcriptional adapter 3